MGNAKPVIDIRIARPENMGDIRVVAHDLDRRAQPRHGKRFVIFRYRSREEPVEGEHRNKREQDNSREEADEPAKNTKHNCLVDWGRMFFR